MGAEMISASLCHRQEVDVSANKEKTLAYIDSLTMSDLALADGDAFWDVTIDPNLAFDTDPNALDQVKAICRNQVEQFIETIVNLNDVDSRDWLGWTIYWTGGSSWGDSPTDAYDVFCAFDNMGQLGDRLFSLLGLEWPPTGPDTFHIHEEASLTDV